MGARNNENRFEQNKTNKIETVFSKRDIGRHTKPALCDSLPFNEPYTYIKGEHGYV